MRQFIAAALSLALITTACNNSNNQNEEHKETAQAQSLPPQSELDEQGTTKLMTVIADYYQLKDAFVASDAAKADAAAQKLIASNDSLKTHLQTDSTHGTELIGFLDSVGIGSQGIMATNDPSTEKKRIPFETVSNAMFGLINKAQLKNAGVYRQYCPMAFNDKGAYWLSNETEIKNPYFGKKMLECGEVTDTLK